MSSCLHLPLCIIYLLLLSLHVSYVQFAKAYPMVPTFLAPSYWLVLHDWELHYELYLHVLYSTFQPPLKCVIPVIPYSFKDLCCATYLSNWGLHGTVNVSSKTSIWSLRTSNKIVEECLSNLKVNSHLAVLIKSYPKWKIPLHLSLREILGKPPTEMAGSLLKLTLACKYFL